MKEHVKTVLKTSLVLTIIASCGALLIAGTNLLTSPIIEKNEVQKEVNGLSSVFGKDAIFAEPVEIEDDNYLSKYYDATVGTIEGRVYKASGKNSYGEIDLLVGLVDDLSLYNICVLNNGQSFGTVLQENYIDPIASAEDKEAALQNVTCGATFGAKLVKTLVEASMHHYEQDLEAQDD